MVELYPVNREIDMRDELERTFTGDDWEISKEQLYIIRRMRRDEYDALIACACQSNITQEGDRDRFCPFCFGEGFLWDEQWFSGLRVHARMGSRRRVDRADLSSIGVLDPDVSFMYCNHLVSPTNQDRIIGPQIDVEGNIIWPIKIYFYWTIDKTDPVRSDEGRLEYWHLTIRERHPGRNRD